MRHFISVVSLAALGLALSAASCRINIIEDPSAFAVEAGQSTMILGSDCSRPLALGYDSCPLRDGEKCPC